MRRSITLTPTRVTVLHAIAQGVEPQIPGHAARKARQELVEAGLVSSPHDTRSDRSWATWGLTLDGRIIVSQLTQEAA